MWIIFYPHLTEQCIDLFKKNVRHQLTIHTTLKSELYISTYMQVWKYKITLSQSTQFKWNKYDQIEINYRLRSMLLYYLSLLSKYIFVKRINHIFATCVFKMFMHASLIQLRNIQGTRMYYVSLCTYNEVYVPYTRMVEF